eukprot:12798388-Ditylum_brightwellii.AAC.1
MSKITQARKKLHHAQSQAAELRDKMLEEMPRDCATHGNLDTATIIKNIYSIENRLKHHLGSCDPLQKARLVVQFHRLKKQHHLRVHLLIPKP